MVSIFDPRVDKHIEEFAFSGSEEMGSDLHI